MPQTEFYNVHHLEAMGVLIVVYFFMSGLAAGTFLTVAACRIAGGPKYAKIEKIAAIATPILLGPGLLCLLLDLHQPLRFFNLFLYPNPTAVASWGVYLMSIFMGLSVLYAFLHVMGWAGKAKVLAYVGGVLALAAGLYSGMLLYQMPGRELWHSALVPVIFLASAVASGLAVVLVLSGSAEPEQRRVLSKALAIAVGVDLILALTEILTLSWGAGKTEIANVVLFGTYGLLFIGVYVILGLVLPLLALARRQPGRFAQVIAALLVLAGTAAMRYVIVMGGQVLPLT